MTAVLGADPRVGSTTPRLFTPPLPQHCGPDGELLPEHTWGPLCCEFLTDILGWTLLPYQRWLYDHALEKGPDGCGFRFQFLLVLIARQSGKTKWGKGLGLWRLFMDPFGRPDPHWPGAQLAVIAAQNLDYAEATLKEVADEIRGNTLLAPELIAHHVTNGKHRAILTNWRTWRAATASRKGGRSLSVDYAWLDEIREHTTWDAWRAIVPTTTVRPLSQVVLTSNAGDARSVVLRSLREAAVRRVTTGDTDDTDLGFFEWSVPEDVDPRDDQFWYLANPAMGLLNDFTLDDLRAHFEQMEAGDMPGFQTEYLCQWVSSLQPGIIPAQAWADTVDPESKRATGAPVYACIDVNYHRTRSYLAIAAGRPDGRIHIEVIKDGKGTDWLTPWLVRRQNRFAGICVQKTGAPASALIGDLRAAGITITDWGAPTADLAAGAGLFYDGVTTGTIRHRPSVALDRAVSATIARVAGDAWFFDRRHSPVDAAPLVACAGAVWLLNNPPAAAVPTVHAWPDEDTLAAWEKDETWPTTT